MSILSDFRRMLAPALRQTRGSISIDARAMLELPGRIDTIEAAIKTMQSRRTARHVSNVALDIIRQETRQRLNKNPTGALEKSWRVKSRRDRGAIAGRTWDLRSNKPYARIHNRGGIIRPKRARKLTIPVTGISRAVKKGPRHYPGRLRATPWGLVDLAGRTQYVWADRVRIPPTYYIDRSLERIDDFIDLAFLRLTRRASRGRVTTRLSVR